MGVLWSKVQLVNHHCLGLSPCFAALNALVPRVLKLCVVSSSAVSEPRTASTATTGFSGFRDGAALETYGADGRRCAGG